MANCIQGVPRERLCRYTAAMKLARLLIPLALVLCSLNTWSQWVWLDKDGRKVFSDRAPATDVPERNILKSPTMAGKKAADGAMDAAPAPVPAAAASAPSPLDKALQARKKQAADAEAAQRKAEQDRIDRIKADNCARARQAKAAIDSGVRLGRTTANGEHEFLDDAQRAAEGQRIQGLIASECQN